MNPCHSAHMSKLNRISGQIEAIKNMITDKRYCVDIMIQVKAARSALKAIELSILEAHMMTCLDECLNNQNQKEEKISEIIKLLKKYE